MLRSGASYPLTKPENLSGARYVVRRAGRQHLPQPAHLRRGQRAIRLCKQSSRSAIPVTSRRRLVVYGAYEIGDTAFQYAARIGVTAQTIRPAPHWLRITRRPAPNSLAQALSNSHRGRPIIIARCTRVVAQYIVSISFETGCLGGAWHALPANGAGPRHVTVLLQQAIVNKDFSDKTVGVTMLRPSPGRAQLDDAAD